MIGSAGNGSLPRFSFSPVNTTSPVLMANTNANVPSLCLTQPF